MISSSSSIRKTALSVSSMSGICDQIERVRTIRFVYLFVYSKGAFIRGRRFLEVGRLFEAIRFLNSSCELMSILKETKVRTQWAHHGQTTSKQRCSNVINVDTTLFRRRLTMMSLLGHKSSFKCLVAYFVKSFFRMGAY